MSSDHSTPTPPNGKAAKPVKPAKPRPDFPLYAHAAGYWAKKIRGTTHYFGPWDDPDGAERQYLEEREDLEAGRLPKRLAATVDVKEIVNRFLNKKQSRVDSGELSPRTWQAYKDACDQLIAGLGKRRSVLDLGPDDFAKLRTKLAKRNGVVRLGNTIQYIKSVFLRAYRDGLIERPVRFGDGFDRPSKKTLRLHKAKQGPKLFTAEEIRALLGEAGTPFKAMILLAVNCGFGNADCGALPIAAVDLARGWLNFPRPKTGIERRCPLWPETVAAIREALAKRPEPKDPDHADLLFVTKYGKPWDWEDSTVTHEFRKLTTKLGLNGNRGFYALRHTHRTIGDETRDQVACDHLMGHAREDMASVYRERIGDDRLRAVTDHVRAWLFSPAEAKPTDTAAAE